MSIREATNGYVLKRDEGRAIWFLGGLLTWKAVGEDTGGQYELVEQLGPHGFAAPIHSHVREAEGFYVVEGEVTFILGDQRVEAPAGTFVFVPPNAKHGFVVESPEARFLTFITPAGLEAFFDELSEPAKARTLPPPLEGPLDAQQIETVMTRYDQKMFGPPPAPRT